MYRDDRERGAAMVEFALVISLLTMVLFGIVEFGIAHHVRQGLVAAAREGARIGSLPQTTNSEVKARVLESVSAIDTDPANEQCPPTEAGQYCVTVSPSVSQPCDGARGRTVRVDVAYRQRIDVPLVTSQDVLLSGHGIFRCEV